MFVFLIKGLWKYPLLSNDGKYIVNTIMYFYLISNFKIYWFILFRINEVISPISPN
jgi:hypothetical protein